MTAGIVTCCPCGGLCGHDPGLVLGVGTTGTASPAAPGSDMIALGSGPLQEVEGEASPADPLPAQILEHGLEMPAGRVDVGGVADPDLDVHGCGDTDDVGEFRIADEPANVDGSLDVDVDGYVDGRPDGRHLLQREVRGNMMSAQGPG